MVLSCSHSGLTGVLLRPYSYIALILYRSCLGLIRSWSGLTELLWFCQGLIAVMLGTYRVLMRSYWNFDQVLFVSCLVVIGSGSGLIGFPLRSYEAPVDISNELKCFCLF